VVGAPSSGKTSFLSQLVQGKASEEPQQRDQKTWVKQLPMEENQMCVIEFTKYNSLEMLDTEHHAVVEEGVKAIDGLIIMFNVGSQSSFQSIPAINVAVNTMRTGIPTMLCATGADLPDDAREVTKTQIDDLIAKMGYPIWEVTTKAGNSTEDAVRALVKYIKGGGITAPKVKPTTTTTTTTTQDVKDKEKEEEPKRERSGSLRFKKGKV
jgi:GTPase SAR1 family protein